MQKNSYVKTDSFYIERYTMKKPQANMHYHHAYEMYYIIEGEREYFIGDTFFKSKKGDLVWIPANMLHRTDGKGATRILLYFKPEFINKYFQQPMLKKLLRQEPFIFRADDANAKQLGALLNNLLLEYNNQSKTSDKECEALLAGYLFQVLFLIQTTQNNYLADIPEDNRASQIIKYINKNYAHISSMDEVASNFFISKFYLCHIFKETIGVSFISYLNTIRIKAACELLNSQDLFISEIATRCGFNSTPYFCKVFKDEKGVSPGEYRNKQRK